jgi:hypothetical protein
MVRRTACDMDKRAAPPPAPNPTTAGMESSMATTAKYATLVPAMASSFAPQTVSS